MTDILQKFGWANRPLQLIDEGGEESSSALSYESQPIRHKEEGLIMHAAGYSSASQTAQQPLQ